MNKNSTAGSSSYREYIGDLSDRRLSMYAAAVGGELLGFMKRTFHCLYLLQPIAEGESDGKANNNEIFLGEEPGMTP